MPETMDPHDVGTVSTSEAERVFPSGSFGDAGDYWVAYSAATARAAASVDGASLMRAAELLLAAYRGGATVFSCGNGGSASIANHLQCDHVKNVRTGTDLSPKVVSLSNNVELLTAIANDIAYEHVFAYQLEAQSRPGDVLVAISSSGRSPNIVRALEWARANGLGTVALTGFDGGRAREIADVAVHTDSNNYGVIEDLHQALMHVLAQFIRQSAMSVEEIRSSKF